MYHYFLARHLPAALHLPGILQPEQGLNAAFLPAALGAALAGGLVIFPYIMGFSRLG